VFLAVLLILDLFLLRTRVVLQKSTWRVIAILLLLTLIFDNMIVGFGIVTYNPENMLGIRLWYAPIEDFFYAIAAPILVKSLMSYGNR